MSDYTTALYIRLSAEDGDKSESDSVKNQRDLLTNYTTNHPELSKTKILTFVDDGYTGLNLNRPGVQQMLELAKKGEIQCIVVKDISRFSRSDVDTMEYLDLIFPFLNVRFIAVTNSYDSDQHKGATAGMEVSISALLARMYSLDLSMKCKTALKAKARRGEYTYPRPPYGYVKSQTQKNKLEIDPEAAEVVKRIFNLAAEGKKVYDIAVALNENGIESPLAYRKRNKTALAHDYGAKGGWHWKYHNVSSVLRDERYTGKLITGKVELREPGTNKMVAVPKEQWIVVENAHPAIVSQDVYDAAQKIMRAHRNTTEKKKEKSVFGGKVICGHCGYKLALAYKGAYSCISQRYTGNAKCFEEKIPKEWLESKVSEAVNEAIDTLKLRQQQNMRDEVERKNAVGEFEAELKKLQRLTAGVNEKKAVLFEAYATGEKTESEFTLMNAEYTQELEKATARTAELNAELEALQTLVEQTQLPPEIERSGEYTDEMMQYVKLITVYGKSEIVVDVEL